MKRPQLLLTILILFLIFGCQKDIVSHNTPPIVNAGKDTTVTLINATDSLRLTGSAADKEGQVVGYLWSEVSGPNTALITTPGSASTYISGLTPGTYVFQLMATDNEGETGVKSLNVTVKGQQLFNVTYQPNQNPFDVLLGLNSTGNVSDNAAPELAAVAWTNGGPPAFARGIFKFDLSSIPSTAKIISAKLTLYSNPTPLNGDLIHANYGTNNAMLIQRVTSNWANTVTWQTQPSGDAFTQIVIPHTNQSLLDLTDVDVTNMVTIMVQGSNNGFLIKLQDETSYNSRVFCSSRYSNAAKHPKLIIQYLK
jgi:hypothetical protein